MSPADLIVKYIGSVVLDPVVTGLVFAEGAAASDIGKAGVAGCFTNAEWTWKAEGCVGVLGTVDVEVVE